jgi:hypothetical protein
MLFTKAKIVSSSSPVLFHRYPDPLVPCGLRASAIAQDHRYPQRPRVPVQVPQGGAMSQLERRHCLKRMSQMQ